MDSKILLFLVILILALLLLGCTQSGVSNNSQSNQTFNTASNGSGTNVQTANASNIQVVDKCSQIKDVADQIDCYLALAKETNNSYFCDKATVDDTDTGFWSVVSKYGPDYLVWVDRHRTMCYTSIALATHDQKICDKLSQTNASGEIPKCKDEANENKANWCNRFDQNKRDDCFSDYAGDKHNIEFCNLIKDSSTKDDCYKKVAQLTGNLELCKLTKETQDCYYQIAMSTKKISTCDYLQNASEKNYCKWILIKFNKDVNVCIELDITVDKNYNAFNNGRDDCFEYFARELVHYEYCGPISDTKKRDVCYLAMARNTRKTKDSKPCEYISSKEDQLICFSIFDQTVPTKKTVQAIVKGDQALSPTGICVEKDTSIQIKASGNIVFSGGGSNASPNGVDLTLPSGFHWPCENAKGVSLIMKLNQNGECLEVGNQKTLTPIEDSEIYLGVNDEYLPGNTGEWQVEIQAFTKACK